MKKGAIIVGIGVIVITAIILSTSGYLKYLSDHEMYFVSDDKYELNSYDLNENLSATFICEESLNTDFDFSTVDGAKIKIIGCQMDTDGIFIQFGISNESKFTGGSIVSLDTLDGTTEMDSHPSIYLRGDNYEVQGKLVGSGPYDGVQNYRVFFSNETVLIDTNSELTVDFGGLILNDFTRK